MLTSHARVHLAHEARNLTESAIMTSSPLPKSIVEWNKAVKRRLVKLHERNVDGQFDYSDSEASFVRVNRSVSTFDFVCKTHGKVHQSYQSHLVAPCPECVKTRARDAILFRVSVRFYIVHGNRYDYSLVPTTFTKVSQFVDIVCPQHGVFPQRVTSHYQGSGCPKCGVTNKSPATLQEEQVAREARELEMSECDVGLGKKKEEVEVIPLNTISHIKVRLRHVRNNARTYRIVGGDKLFTSKVWITENGIVRQDLAGV